MSKFEALDGGCCCGQIRYQLLRDPVLSICCYCRYCQRLLGATNAWNLFVEPEAIKHAPGGPTHPGGVSGENVGDERLPPGTYETKIYTPSGKERWQVRCERCHSPLWFKSFTGLFCLRAGSLDRADKLRQPDAHIFCKEKPSWLKLSPDIRTYEEQLDREEVLGPEARERIAAAVAAEEAAKKKASETEAGASNQSNVHKDDEGIEKKLEKTSI